ncbi:MAG: glycosyltransferase [Petrimonas sp.]|jgi:glycosyltransferase involved in cell wall biosynthesis|uniref:glycosyltransferase n=1 Tax=Petrimonas sp. TaxID=2023866 RepID=UPI000ECE6B6F|nr:glycosyltransferase [Petrimonas sp.]MDD3541824.1 glycosyltransferase [Petrimonas sp.]MDD4536838.1 glycosyltransferase [Petrimonas sp.]NLU30793.1 glycosyltransferase [Bacteroidales bacterium]HAC72641.1 glycosyl transferase family 1 [Porphyromonadaceae bacterium]
MEKLKVLINAYACSPDRGSEPGMGWNWCVHLANHCELYIISEGEYRESIEAALATLPQAGNMHFYYNPIPEKVREMCRKQGDWRFYVHYKNWQKETLNIARKIIAEHKIDVLHQLNMIGFREPGYLWKIEGIPFVWGPVGGLKQFPLAYLKDAGLKMRFFIRLKNLINTLQIKYDVRVDKALRRAGLLISSIPDSYRALKKYKQLESVLIPETGCFITDNVPTGRFYNREFNVMWVGKFDFRKQLPLALNALAAANNKQIILNVYGQGNEVQEREAKQLVSELGISDQVVWHGNQSHAVVQQAMREAQLFFFTSVSEDTSTVILEAISNRLPVLCFDACGFGAVIDETVGRKIPLTNPRESVRDFAEQLNVLCSKRELLEKMSLSCKYLQQKLSWDEKAKKVTDLYWQVVSDFVSD